MTGRLQNPSIFSPILPRGMVISHISGFGTSPATGIHISDISGSLKDGAGLSHASNQAIRIDETGGVILNSSGSAGNPSYAFFASVVVIDINFFDPAVCRKISKKYL